MQTRITVVVPTYRRPALLHNCIQALANQRFDKEAYEVIIVSDGPDELTQQAVAQWVNKNVAVIRCISLCISLPDKKGPAAARNAGWQQANGVMVAFTDDDCLPDPLWLDAIWGAYRHDSEGSGYATANRLCTQHTGAGDSRICYRQLCLYKRSAAKSARL